MASITLSNGKLGVKFSDGTLESTRYEVTKKDSEETIGRQINLAIGFAYGKHEDKKEELGTLLTKEKENISTIKGLLSTKKPVPSEKKATPSSATPPKSVPQSRIDVMQNIAAGDKGKAATELVKNKKEVDTLLGNSKVRATVTVALFNQLAKNAEFVSFLNTLFQVNQFSKLAEHLSRHSNKLDGADPETLQAAVLYMHYFLLNYGVKNLQFQGEIGQLDAFKDGKNMKMDGPLDTDTIAAAELYLRRAKEPTAGLWTAPKETETTAKPEPKTMRASPLQQLQKFYDENWKTLTPNLVDAAKDGDPAKIVIISRKLPEGYRTLEDTLVDLKKNDIRQAFIQAFNNLRENTDFKDFLKRRHNDLLIKNEVKIIIADNPEYVTIIQEFLNEQAKGNGRLGKDIAKLNAAFSQKEQETNARNPSRELLTLAALALYAWRMKNPFDYPGKWAEGRNIGVTVDKPVVKRILTGRTEER